MKKTNTFERPKSSRTSFEHAKGERAKSRGEKPAFGDKRSYGSKPAYGEKKSYGDKPAFGEKRGFDKFDKADRPRRPHTEERVEKPRYDDVICGRNAVLEAIKSGRQVNKVLLADNTDAAFSASVFRLCKEHNIPCHQIPKQKLINYAGPDHHGIAAETAAVTYVEISDILDAAMEKKEQPFVILLDGVEDPHNLGAVIRTALCAGAHGVVVPRNRAAAVNQTVMKTSAGGAAHLPIARVANISQAIRELQEAGLWVAERV